MSKQLELNIIEMIFNNSKQGKTPPVTDKQTVLLIRDLSSIMKTARLRYIEYKRSPSYEPEDKAVMKGSFRAVQMKYNVLVREAASHRGRHVEAQVVTEYFSSASDFNGRAGGRSNYSRATLETIQEAARVQTQAVIETDRGTRPQSDSTPLSRLRREMPVKSRVRRESHNPDVLAVISDRQKRAGPVQGVHTSRQGPAPRGYGQPATGLGRPVPPRTFISSHDAMPDTTNLPFSGTLSGNPAKRRPGSALVSGNTQLGKLMAEQRTGYRQPDVASSTHVQPPLRPDLSYIGAGLHVRPQEEQEDPDGIRVIPVDSPTRRTSVPSQRETPERRNSFPNQGEIAETLNESLVHGMAQITSRLEAMSSTSGRGTNSTGVTIDGQVVDKSLIDQSVQDEPDAWYLSLPFPWNKLPRRYGKTSDEAKKIVIVPFEGDDAKYLSWRMRAINLITQAYLDPSQKVIHLQKAIEGKSCEVLKSLKENVQLNSIGLRTMIEAIEARYGGIERIELALFHKLMHNGTVNTNSIASVERMMSRIVQIRDHYLSEHGSREHPEFQNNFNSRRTFQQVLISCVHKKDVHKFEKFCILHGLSRNLDAIHSWLTSLDTILQTTSTYDRYLKRDGSSVHHAIQYQDTAPEHSSREVSEADDLECEVDKDLNYVPESPKEDNTFAFSCIQAMDECDGPSDGPEDAVDNPQPMDDIDYVTMYGSTSRGRTGQYEPPTCDICKQQHPYIRCGKFMKMDEVDRVKHLFDAKRCVNCFNKGHWGPNCKSPRTCGICKEKHNALVHEGLKTLRAKKGQATASRQSFGGKPRPTFQKRQA